MRLAAAYVVTGSLHPITMSTTTAPRPSPKLYDLDVTIVSAKHLKNVNWKNGDLKPYVILWVDPERREATKPDDSGSNRPVWNERFVLPLTLHPRDSILTLEIFHSKPSETPKPLVGTLRFELRELLIGSEEPPSRLRTLELNRPSGRPNGKIRLKLAIIERPMGNYQAAPTSGYYYSTAPPPPLPPHSYRGYSISPYSSLPPPLPYPSSLPPPPPSSSSPPPPQPYPYSAYADPHSGYYSAYFSMPPSTRQCFERQSSYGGPGPSAPVDYTPYDYQKRNSGKSGIGSGLAVGVVAGALGGLVLEEGIKYEEEKIAERVENDLASTSRDDHYGDYRNEY